MIKEFAQRFYHVVAGDEFKIQVKEDAVVFFIPVSDFFPQYEQLKSIFLGFVEKNG